MTEDAVLDEPVIVVSCDTHIGPRLVEDLRPYCPARYLEAFDDFAAQADAYRAKVFAQVRGREATGHTPNRQTAGHHDAHARIRDLDFDGVAAEVIFHGSQNEEPIPFGTFVAFLGAGSDDLELVAAGRQIYNRWLADFVSVEPERHVGLAQLPLWDVDAAVREVEWAREHGLRGVNFPAPRPELPPYNDPSWEPLWAACASLDLPLTTHSGAGDPSAWSGREAFAVMSIESGGWFSRRALHQMIFGGVFERHPRLQLVLTEQPGDWWSYTLRELDSAFIAHRQLLGDQVPRRPSEYCATNVSIGASFLARFEAEDAIRQGYTDRVLWGSDYPHMEGTWQFPSHPDDPSIGRLALRNTFATVPPEETRRMVGQNAIRVYGLDEAKLGEVARRIAAPTLRELATPIDAVPAGASRFAFREFGPWA
jgi:predicted TIM-barrel fold metal-dependent hydrolase